jgi:CheY-like chemotaxis protein
VKDTGIGIDKESFKKVFDNFTKEDRGTLKYTEGSGLGLSIAKGMIQIIGGSIRLESELGVGSGFFFTIPLTKSNETIPSGTSGGKHRKSISGVPIMIAEDDEINFLYLKTLLNQNSSAEIIHALNGKEALDIFIQNPDIGLILMDIKMPVMDGIEATQQIKALKKDVPIIAITAYAMAGDEAKILNAGCDSYISKPINKESLLGKIAEYIVI